jgi:hypothetical protein
MNAPEFIEYLKLGHGLFNTLMMLLFVIQGWLGLKIRRKRKAAIPKDFTVIKGIEGGPRIGYDGTRRISGWHHLGLCGQRPYFRVPRPFRHRGMYLIFVDNNISHFQKNQRS